MNNFLIGLFISLACHIVVPRQPQALILSVIVTAIWILSK